MTLAVFYFFDSHACLPFVLLPKSRFGCSVYSRNKNRHSFLLLNRRYSGIASIDHCLDRQLWNDAWNRLVLLILIIMVSCLLFSCQSYFRAHDQLTNSSGKSLLLQLQWRHLLLPWNIFRTQNHLHYFATQHNTTDVLRAFVRAQFILQPKPLFPQLKFWSDEITRKQKQKFWNRK